MRFVLSLGVLVITGVLALTAVRSAGARLGPVEVYGRSGASWLLIAVVGAGAATAAFIAGATVVGELLGSSRAVRELRGGRGAAGAAAATARVRGAAVRNRGPRRSTVQQTSRWLIGGAALVFVANMLRLAIVDGTVALIVGAVMSVGMGVAVLWFVVSGDRRRQAEALPGDLFRWHGTIRLADIRESSSLMSQCAGARTRGPTWLGGTLVLRSEGAQWLAAWNGRRLGLTGLDIPWSEVVSAEAEPMTGILGPAVLSLTLRDGSQFQVVTRGLDRLKSALNATWTASR